MFLCQKAKSKSYLIYNYVKTAKFHIWETGSKEYFSLLSIKPATQIRQITQITVRTVKSSKSKLVHPFLFQSVSSGSQGRQSGSCCQISCKLASLSSEGGGRRTKIDRTEVKSPIQQILWNSALWRTDSNHGGLNFVVELLENIILTRLPFTCKINYEDIISFMSKCFPRLRLNVPSLWGSLVTVAVLVLHLVTVFGNLLRVWTCELD